MILYVDASAVVAVLANEPASLAVDGLVRHPDTQVMISDFAVAESSAALARNSRVASWTEAETRDVFQDLDAWASGVGEMTEVTPADITDATTFVRLPGIALRAPDAIHIAAAHRLGATLLTLDRGMAHAAAALGVSHLNPAEAQMPGEVKD